MSTVNNIKLERYVPVRKLRKLTNQTVVLQKDLPKSASNDEGKTLPDVA